MVVNVNVPNVEKVNVFVKNHEDTCTLDMTLTAGVPSDWRGKVREIGVPTDPNCGQANVTKQASQSVKALGGRCLGLFHETILA